MSEASSNYHVVDFAAIPGVACPCGTARRALMEVDSVPYSLHITEISVDAKTHYHKRITETYFILECQPDARLELDGECVKVEPRTAIVIPPLTRHRAIGRMKVVIIASPKFDPADEWLD